MQAVTIRFPEDLAAGARSESEAGGQSMNQFVVDAVADAVARRRAQRALRNMSERHARMKAAGQVSPPSEPLLRDLREGIGRRG
ncbi:MAG: hypothetical protein J2P39_02975 [Candidatus Dormibacteraeota bacterium]|nr:hypothetical protein [Candidatus Dormibacteraeota bacterium]